MAHPNSRWLRFGLRTMFIVMTVLCVSTGWKVREATKQKQVVAWVKKMGGEVAYDYQPKIGSIFWLDANRNDEPPGPRWLVDLIGVDFFSTVTGVRLDGTEVTDLTPLTNLSTLKELKLERTVADLSPLAKMTDLRELALKETEVDLAPLAQMTKLETLSLASLHVRDCSPLAKMPNLTRLYLFSVNSTDHDFDDDFAMFERALPNCCVSKYSPIEITISED